MFKVKDMEYSSYFFVGIGGVSMSALAKILVNNGKIVAGHDRVLGQSVDSLRQLGIFVTNDLNVDAETKDGIINIFKDGKFNV